LPNSASVFVGRCQPRTWPPGTSPEIPQSSIALFVQLLQRDIPQLATSFGAKKNAIFIGGKCQIPIVNHGIHHGNHDILNEISPQNMAHKFFLKKKNIGFIPKKYLVQGKFHWKTMGFP